MEVCIWFLNFIERLCSRKLFSLFFSAGRFQSLFSDLPSSGCLISGKENGSGFPFFLLFSALFMTKKV